MSSTRDARFRACWLTDIGAPPFDYEAIDWRAANRIINLLSDYDDFLLKTGRLPDTANAGFVEWMHPTETHGEWWELDESEALERGFA